MGFKKAMQNDANLEKISAIQNWLIWTGYLISESILMRTDEFAKRKLTHSNDRHKMPSKLIIVMPRNGIMNSVA